MSSPEHQNDLKGDSSVKGAENTPGDRVLKQAVHDREGREQLSHEQKSETVRLKRGGHSGITREFGQLELLDSEKGKGEIKKASPVSGALSWQDGKGIHKLNVENGQIFDSKKKLVGIIDNDDKIAVFNKDYADISKPGSHLMFRGENLKDNTQVVIGSHEGQKGLCGKLSRPDGSSSYDVVDGYVYEGNHKLIGRISENGKLQTPAKEDGSRSQEADINSQFSRWKFEGSEDGHRRVFVASSDLSQGTIHIPRNEVPAQLRGRGSGRDESFTVKQGMLINEDGVQVGLLQAPDTAHGALAGGKVQWWGEQKAVDLKDLKGASFSLQNMGESGFHSRKLEGVCLGKDAGGTGIYDIQTARDQEKSQAGKIAAAANELDVAHKNVFELGWGELSGHNAELRKAKDEAIKSEHTRLAKLDALTTSSADGKIVSQLIRDQEAHSDRKPVNKVDPKEAAKSALEKVSKPSLDIPAFKHKAGETKQDKIAQAKEKIDLPVIDSKNAGKVNGHLRIDSDVYEINHGKLYRMHNEHGKAVADAKPCGELKPGYRAHLNGVGDINLANENRVLMEFNTGDKQNHRIVGLGKSRTIESADGTPRQVGGGLVSTDELHRESQQMLNEIKSNNVEYAKSRTMTSGLWDSISSGFGQSATPEQIMKKMSEQVEQDSELLKRSMDKMFNSGFNPDAQVQGLDASQRVVQCVLDDCNLRARDAASIKSDVQAAYSQADEALVMSAMTVATAGTGALVSSAANAGKFAWLGRAAQAGTVATRIGAGAASGSAVRTAMTYHEGQDAGTTAQQAVRGAVEGATMSIPGIGQSVKKAQHVSEGIGLGAEALQAGSKSATIQSALAEGTISQTDAWLAQGAAGKLANAIGNNGMKNAIAKTAFSAADNAVQATGFALANNKGEGIRAEEIVTGTVFGMAGHAASAGLSRESGLMSGLNKIPGNAKINMGEFAEHAIAGAPANAGSGFVSGGLNEIQPALEEERQRIAKDKGVDPKSIDDQTLWKNLDYAQVYKRMCESGAIAALGNMGPGAFTSHMEALAERVRSTPTEAPARQAHEEISSSRNDHDALQKNLHERFSDPENPEKLSERGEHFKRNVEALEKVVPDHQERSRVHQEINKLLTEIPQESRDSNADILKEQSDRTIVAEQILDQIIDTNRITQSSNTCNVTILENLLAASAPGDYARIIATAATEGQLRLSDGTIIQGKDIGACGKDFEALNAENDPESGVRTLASKIFQQYAIEAHWRYKTELKVEQLRLSGEAGDFKFVSSNNTINMRHNGQHVFSGGDLIRSPLIGSQDLVDIWTRLGGPVYQAPLVVLKEGANAEQYPGQSLVKNEREFTELVEQASQKDQPIAIGVDLLRGTLRKSLLPFQMGKGEQIGQIGHVIGIKPEIDSNNQLLFTVFDPARSQDSTTKHTIQEVYEWLLEETPNAN